MHGKGVQHTLSMTPAPPHAHANETLDIKIELPAALRGREDSQSLDRSDAQEATAPSRTSTGVTESERRVSRGNQPHEQGQQQEQQQQEPLPEPSTSINAEDQEIARGLAELAKAPLESFAVHSHWVSQMPAGGSARLDKLSGRSRSLQPGAAPGQKKHCFKGISEDTRSGGGKWRPQLSARLDPQGRPDAALPIVKWSNLPACDSPAAAAAVRDIADIWKNFHYGQDPATAQQYNHPFDCYRRGELLSRITACQTSAEVRQLCVQCRDNGTLAALAAHSAQLGQRQQQQQQQEQQQQQVTGPLSGQAACQPPPPMLQRQQSPAAERQQEQQLQQQQQQQQRPPQQRRHYERVADVEQQGGRAAKVARLLGDQGSLRGAIGRAGPSSATPDMLSPLHPPVRVHSSPAEGAAAAGLTRLTEPSPQLLGLAQSLLAAVASLAPTLTPQADPAAKGAAGAAAGQQARDVAQRLLRLSRRAGPVQQAAAGGASALPTGAGCAVLGAKGAWSPAAEGVAVAEGRSEEADLAVGRESSATEAGQAAAGLAGTAAAAGQAEAAAAAGQAATPPQHSSGAEAGAGLLDGVLVAEYLAAFPGLSWEERSMHHAIICELSEEGGFGPGEEGSSVAAAQRLAPWLTSVVARMARG